MTVHFLPPLPPRLQPSYVRLEPFRCPRRRDGRPDNIFLVSTESAVVYHGPSWREAFRAALANSNPDTAILFGAEDQP
jgi:hypothetical protein